MDFVPFALKILCLYVTEVEASGVLLRTPPLYNQGFIQIYLGISSSAGEKVKCQIVVAAKHDISLKLHVSMRVDRLKEEVERL